MNGLGPESVAAFASWIAVAVLIYLALIALSIWVSYLIMRTAVKNGILLADAHLQLATKTPSPPVEVAPRAPAGWYESSSGNRFWDGREWSTPPRR